MPNPSQNRSSGMRYERLFPLGSGGMATVELAVARGAGGFNRLVVLKSMRKELAGNDDNYKMFLAEARLSARLNHPNVVQVSEIVETSEGVVLVMEYLDGAPLSNVYRLANEALTLAMRLRLICEILAGLHYAHELADFKGKALGVVHRDVSPQNVFVTYDGRIKLLDFGIAKAADSSEQTRAGLIKGRIAYMPAEQLTGAPVDRRTDVYAVGCLLWEAIAGGRMWAAQTERDIARGVLKGNLPSLSARVKVAPELERIVVRATALDPNARYSTAEEMRTDLESYMSATFAPVSARDIGELLLQVSGEARENRRRSIADAIAALESNADEASQKSLTHSGTPSNQQLSSLRLKPLGESTDITGSSSSRTAQTSSSSSGRLAIQDLAEPHASCDEQAHAELAQGGARAGRRDAAGRRLLAHSGFR
ncbi:MAG: serine/threonine-protein kinase [Polyangiaceae bacterium]